MASTQAASFAADAARQVLVLATGVLAITVTFMSDIVPERSTLAIFLMGTGWLALLLSAVAGLSCLYVLAGEVANAEAEGDGARASILTRPILYTSRAQIVAFMVGLVFIVVAAFTALT